MARVFMSDPDMSAHLSGEIALYDIGLQAMRMLPDYEAFARKFREMCKDTLNQPIQGV